MKKIIFSAALVVAFTLGMVSCGNPTTAEATEEEAVEVVADSAEVVVEEEVVEADSVAVVEDAVEVAE